MDEVDVETFDEQAALARLDNDREFLTELAGSFLEACPQAMADLRAAYEAGNSEKLRFTAHKLKGQLAIFVARRPHTLAQQMEDLGDAGGVEQAGSLLDEFEGQVEQLCRALSTFDNGELAG